MNGGFGVCNTQVYVIHDLVTERRERILKMFCDRIFVYGVDTIAAEDDKHYLPNHLVLVQIWFSNGLLQNPKFLQCYDENPMTV